MRLFPWQSSAESRQTKEYSVLPTSAHSSETELVERQMKPKSIRGMIASVILFVLLLSFFILFHLDNTPQRQEPELSCGSSREEALSSGCKFDPMSFSWLQPACYDAELTAEFLDLRPWKWTIDRAGKEEVSLGEVMQGTHDQLYVSWEYHLLHCTYMWRKMHRAVLAGTRVDDYIGNYNHTGHCEKMLLENVALDEINTIIRRKFVGCNIL